ncbi:hypothetical protein FALBO_2505 [Fusarium albosuccineum]|uniref:Uncharacterized protein n=1 Tax=Fusarium albosuccineum TaxID=1237068 RepID=A0A8H4LJL7_9HYPO|nr:hypothetical protein FALBO_2505 [Fusarium albosuccineum]
MVSITSLLMAATVAIGATNAMPSASKAGAAVFKHECEVPGGNCFKWEDGDKVDCEWCCYSFTPPPGSACHTHGTDKCGDKNRGFVFHCEHH